MAYIKDLTRFTYGDSTKRNANGNVLAVGWLEKNTEIMPTAPCGVNGYTKTFLKILRSAPVLNRYRGSHGCEWCTDGTGNGELWFWGSSGNLYVMPELVRHYVDHHGYQIPISVQEDILGYLKTDAQTESHYTEGIFDLSEHNKKAKNEFSKMVEDTDRRNAFIIQKDIDDSLFKAMGEHAGDKGVYDLCTKGLKIDQLVLDVLASKGRYVRDMIKFCPATAPGIPKGSGEAIAGFLNDIEKDFDVKIVLAVESGSRAWGFSSEDSDYDVRFLYIQNPISYIKLPESRKKLDTISRMSHDRLYDMHGWDIGKALFNIYKQNPCLSEWLMSPVVYHEKEEAGEVSWLRNTLFQKYNNRSSIYHYIHMALGNYNKYLKGDTVPQKKYLYVIRPLLCCSYIMRYGGPPPMDIDKLMVGIDDSKVLEALKDLLWAKRASGKEMGEVPRIKVLDDYIACQISLFSDRANGMSERLSKEERSGLYEDCLLKMRDVVRAASAGTVKKEWKW